MRELSGGEVDTLIALVEYGPLGDGDVPSKAARDELIRRGLAVRVVVKAHDGFTAATYQGREAYTARYGGDTLTEAQWNRMVLRPYQWQPGEQPNHAWVQSRWDALTRVGKHGFYETLFQVVREATERVHHLVMMDVIGGSASGPMEAVGGEEHRR